MPKIFIVSGPIIVENGKVLLDKHGDDNFWKFCGGQVRDFELDLIESAKKRTKEEMGVDLEILNEKPFFLLVKKETPDTTADVVLVHFLAKRIGEIKPGKDIKEWDWFDLNNLPENMAPNIEPVLRHFQFI
ncbi:MAG: NUDIX hydrolase [Candidatus Pacebacteria bacterium]|nr:NUDIX hydrolase [Candidatus Paceibacterota bacterium]